MRKFGKELVESMQQAARHAAGKKVRGLRVSRVELPEVKTIRLSLRMSQTHFAAAYRIPLLTLKNWEQGRRMPDALAIAYLLAIKRRPKEMGETVARLSSEEFRRLKRDLTGQALIVAMQASPDRDVDTEPRRRRTRMPVRDVSV
jgi:putative transcriptional regulator